MKFLGVELDVLGLAIRNSANTFKSTFSSAATANRTITLQDKSYTLADNADLVDASASVRGFVNTITQTFSGVKTFSDGLTSTKAIKSPYPIGLIPNSMGETGDNYNHSAWILDKTYVANGMPVSFKTPVAKNWSGLFFDNDIALIPAYLHRMRFAVIRGETNGSYFYEGATIYGLFRQLDTSGQQIVEAYAIRRPDSALTTLASPLNPGNTTVALTDATGWEDSSAYWGNRNIAYWKYQVAEGIYGYKEPSGKINLPYTYTRHLFASPGNAAFISRSGNVLTLNPAVFPSGWPYAALQEGTPVRNSYETGAYGWVLFPGGGFALSGGAAGITYCDMALTTDQNITTITPVGGSPIPVATLYHGVASLNITLLVYSPTDIVTRLSPVTLNIL
jgi:hypothetical protein